MVLTALVVIGLVVWEPGEWAASLGGAALGLLVTMALMQVGLLLGAWLWQVRVSLVAIGVGGEVRTWSMPQRRIVLRNIPLVLSVGLTSVRAPVRRRLWLTSLVSVLLTGAAVAVAWVFLAGTPFGRGIAVTASAVLLHGLLPRRGAGATSPGWFLFRLPWLTGRVVAEMEATPMVNEVSDALSSGELDRAEEIAGRLLAAHPTLLVAIGSQVAVLTMRTRYAEALHMVSRLVGRTDLDQRDMAFVMAEMASSTANAMEAGQLPLDVGMGAAKRASEGAVQLGYPKYRCTGTLAQLALLEDDTDRAIELASQAKRSSESSLARADALATIARAQMAAGDNAAARRTLVEAHELAAWMPRVAETSARLTRPAFASACSTSAPAVDRCRPGVGLRPRFDSPTRHRQFAARTALAGQPRQARNPSAGVGLRPRFRLSHEAPTILDAYQVSGTTPVGATTTARNAGRHYVTKAQRRPALRRRTRGRPARRGLVRRPSGGSPDREHGGSRSPRPAQPVRLGHGHGTTLPLPFPPSLPWPTLFPAPPLLLAIPPLLLFPTLLPFPPTLPEPEMFPFPSVRVLSDSAFTVTGPTSWVSRTSLFGAESAYAGEPIRPAPAMAAATMNAFLIMRDSP